MDRMRYEKDRKDEKKDRGVEGKESKTIRKEKEAAEGMRWETDSRLTTEGQILEEGRKWLGLVPVDLSHIRHFTEDKNTDKIKIMNNCEFEYAREQATQEFFIKELNIDDIKIMESKLSSNKDNGILWVKIGDNNRLKALNMITRISKG